MRSSHNHILLCHPAVALAYDCIAMILVMGFIQPALSAIAFACVASFGLLVSGMRSFARRLAWQLPIALGITLLNCLFVQRGANVLVRVGDFALHAESLLYGLSMALALVTVMELFVLLGEIIDGDDIVSMLGRHLPSTGLLASMSLRLIPRMRHDVEERRDALAACTALSRSKGSFRRASDEVSVAIANAMEDSLVTADSMRARGYGKGGRRSRYARRPFLAGDWLALGCILGFGAIAFVAALDATAGFTFYPRLDNGANAWECVAYAPYFLLPHASFLLWRARWNHDRGGA